MGSHCLQKNNLAKSVTFAFAATLFLSAQYN